jgi:hypothetical protein
VFICLRRCDRVRPVVDSPDLQVARQFLAALGTVAITGERDGLYLWLTSDVEWVTPMRVLTGIDEMRADFTWVTPPANFDLEFEIGELTDLGGGRIHTSIRELYRLKTTGQIAHALDRRIELEIRDQKVARYEMRIVGEAGQAS